jgi:hypothetical protein
MKKVFVFAVGLTMTLGFAQDANAWWWQEEEYNCTVTQTVNLIVYEWSETYEGTRTKCVSGEDWCFSQRCS